MNHSFDVDLATAYGIEEAIIIENLAFWIKKNVANNKNLIDGEFWTYNSAKAFNELFPYMNPRKIARVLEKLEDDGIIKSGNFNKAKYDRTKWYCIVDNDIKNKYKIPINHCNYSFDKMTNGNDKMTNGFVENVQPIPDINTDINTYKKNHDKDLKKAPDKTLDIFENLFRTFGINYTNTNQTAVKALLKTMSEKEVIEYLKETYIALKENKSIKSVARAFSYKIQKQERQVSTTKKEIAKEKKVEKVERPIILDNIKEEKVIEVSELEKIRGAVFMSLVSMDIVKNKKVELNRELSKLNTVKEIKEFIKKHDMELNYE